MRNLFFIVSIFFIAVGCQQKPTKVTAQDPVIIGDLTTGALIKGNTVILDARPPFEFNLSHVPGAINIQWDDFSQGNQKFKGLLQSDLYSAARRLSLIGIDPETRVVVLGKGKQGMGEEGRIAWTLQMLGVKDVYTLLHKSYREMNTTKEVPAIQNKPYWKPQVNESLSINSKLFKQKVSSLGTDIVVLDVRSSQEFSINNLSQHKDVKAKVYNHEWKNFFDEKGLPQKKVEGLLSQSNINKDSEILVISNQGVRSAAVTYVLHFLGYKNVSNFAGGYNQFRDQ